MILLFVLLSLTIGILLNGLADNLPDGRPETSWRDVLPACRYCGRTRKPSDLSALMGLFLRGGECARCHAPRPFRDLLVEIGLGIAIPALWLTGTRLPLTVITDLILVFGSGLLVILDIEHRTVLFGVVLILASMLFTLAWMQGTSQMLWVMGGGVAGMAILSGCYLLGWLLARWLHLGGGIEPLGVGDIWIAGIVGMMNGWPGIVPTAFLGIFLAGGFSVLLILFHLVRRQSIANITFAFGPYLLAAGWLLRQAGGTILTVAFGPSG